MPRRYLQKPKQDSGAGILLVDKPSGWTSHDVVAFIRGYGFYKVGHCGTLDPAATGLLVLLIGAATKLTGHFNGQEKSYKGTLRLGIETDSQDATGKIVRESDWSSVTAEDVRAAMAAFVGGGTQIPPMVSAKKVGGKQLYKLARKGMVVDRAPIDIVIRELHIRSIDLPYVSFDVTCSKGTYIRTLCHDVGARLRCGAHLHALRRTASGEFNIAKAYSMEQIRSWNRDEILQHCLPVESCIQI